MSIGKFDTPPPQAPFTHADLLKWALDLIAWLRSEESDIAETLEEDFVLGGPGVAARLRGLEGQLLSPTGGEDREILSAPAAGKRKVMVDFHLDVETTPPANQVIRFYKKKGATEYDIISAFLADSATPFEWSGIFVIDAIDESIWFENVTGTDDVHWNGSYLDVD